MSLPPEFFELMRTAEKDPDAFSQLEKMIKTQKINPCEHSYSQNVNVTLLGRVIANNMPKLTRLFLKYSDESKTPQNMTSPWFSLVHSGKLSDIQKMAQLSNTTINQVNSQNETPLSLFMKVNMKEKKKNKILRTNDIIDKKLIAFVDAGADLNCYMFSHHLVLHMTKHFTLQHNSYHEIIKWATEKGFNPNIPFAGTNNYFQHILFNPNHNTIDKIDQTISNMLTHRDIDFSYKNKSGQTVIDMLPNLPEHSKARALIEQQYLKKTTQHSVEPALIKAARL